MTILDLYKKYNLMPQLIEHQLRVAAVAKMICDNFHISVNCDDVVTAMLLHDMGNIIKFNLFKFPQFCEPQGFEYWEAVRQDFIKKYGSDEHQAHLKIAREIGAPGRIVELMDAVEFQKIEQNFRAEDWEKKICAYADMRVGPFGVLPLMDRFEEGRMRYEVSPEEERWDLIDFAKEMEVQIFEHCALEPGDVTDEAIKEVVEELKAWNI